MKITGSYNNYMNLTSLLSPLGVKRSGDLVMNVFTTSVGNLQNKIDSQILTEESAAALKQLYDEISDLSASASKLTLSDMNSVFNDRTATSSNNAVLTATAFDAFSQSSGATEAVYDISVSQMVAAQENTGLELSGTGSSVVGEGTNTFQIDIDGQTYELSVEVLTGDTNESALQKIADSINAAQVGVSAGIVIDSESGTQHLVLESNEAGTSSTFAISDVAGNVVSGTGVGVVSTAAQDTAYTVDGMDYTSETNTIYLDDGLVTVNLEGVGDVTLTVAPAESEIKNAVTSLVSEINSIMDFVESNGSYIKDDVLNSIDAFIADHRNNLASFGITLGEGGRLQTDNSKLSEAVGQKLLEIKDTFGGVDGLSVQINNYASVVSINSPIQFAKEADGLTADFVDYIYGSSTGMLQLMLQGIVLDNYI